MGRTSAWRRTRQRARPRRIWCLALICLLWADPALTGGPRAEVRAQDDQGRDIVLRQPARRVIALYGALNEVVAGLGREDILVARTSADRLPASILRLPVIGTHMRPNIEAVLAQKPDLVLQLAGRKEASLPVDALRRHGVTVAVFRASSFAELFSVVRRIGILTGAEGPAEALVRGMEARLTALDARVARTTERPRVLFEVRSPNMLAAGRGGLVDEIIRRAGGVNCVTEPGRFARPDEEEILRLAPEAYLIQRGPMNPAPLPLDRRPRLRQLAAAKAGRAWFVDEGRYSRPGPQSVDAAEELAALLHPELTNAAPKAAAQKSRPKDGK